MRGARFAHRSGCSFTAFESITTSATGAEKLKNTPQKNPPRLNEGGHLLGLRASGGTWRIKPRKELFAPLPLLRLALQVVVTVPSGAKPEAPVMRDEQPEAALAEGAPFR